MKCLVTGDTGFIGSFLVKKLRSMGHSVDGFNTQTGNIFEKEDVKLAVAGKDIVFHLAGVTGVVSAEQFPSRSYYSNVVGTMHIANLCHTNNIKLVFPSTGMVYGDKCSFPMVEKEDVDPKTMYGYHKLAAERCCRADRDLILRLGNVYGPSARCHSVVTKFIKWVTECRNIPMFQNKEFTRDFVFVDDVVDAMVLGFDHAGIFNVGSGVETKIIDLLEMVSKTLEMPYTLLDMVRSLPGEKKRIWLDISKIKKLGWEPKVNLDEGIKKCL